jgi:hypothetical protein
MTPSPDHFEKLASFYLGRQYDLTGGSLKDDLLMYDAKDLCTHAMCVGMTGSGKTGLCLALLEEAAIDGIPAICIDPKGDLANLMLTFPDMTPDDFRPWLESEEASRKGMSLDDFAADRAKVWKEGLASWGQTPERVKKFRDSVDINIYTPGSSIGLPLTVLKSFDAPPPEVVDDTEAMRNRVTGAASGLLTLMGIDADPLLSSEHILISSILDSCWRDGKNVSIGSLIGLIQSPPITRVGVLDLDSFMPPAERSKLSMRLNNLLASPAFASWMTGEALSIKKLFHSNEGKPQISILSIAHLSDSERMFFVTILLNELLAWMRTQSGTSSLRAMFYMDEVAGYFPPVQNPPSKPPMLTLLKQARAFGLGIALATQNPVDLDYKGLSNIGTWFLGRLQTERDKQRVIEGLEGAAIQSGNAFDRNEMERMLAGLGNRVFLMNNVHDDGTRVFQTRWALSFLAGPLAREQITRLMSGKKSALEAKSAASAEAVGPKAVVPVRPVAPSGVTEKFLCPTRVAAKSTKLVYRPAVLGVGTLHFVRESAKVDCWLDAKCIVQCGSDVADDFWEQSQSVPEEFELIGVPEEGIEFSELPTALCSAANFRALEKQFKDYLYRHHTMTLYKSTLLGAFAPGAKTEGEARIHFDLLAREARDQAIDELRSKFATKMAALDKKIQAAQERVAKEEAQYQQEKMSTLVSIGSTLLGAFMGRKMASSTNIGKISTAARASSRTMQQKGDIDRANMTLEDVATEQKDLNKQFEEELDELAQKYAVDRLELETTVIPPRKGDLKSEPPTLIWTPWSVDAQGIASPLFETSPLLEIRP